MMARPILLLAPLLAVGMLFLDLTTLLAALVALLVATQLPALWRACDVVPSLPLVVVIVALLIVSFPW